MKLFVLLAWAFALLASSMADAATVERTFTIANMTISRLCQTQVITAINGKMPGPTLHVREGDTVVIHAINKSPYNITLHWHGIFQLLSGWADGPEYVTQCPIQPGKKYTYRFTIQNQEGTLWWHAHAGYLRATVFGALIIRPKAGNSYPFPKPYKEIPIILSEWWNRSIVEVGQEQNATGAAFAASNAFFINGKGGDLYPCAHNDTYKVKVKQGKTYLLRIINSALNIQLFFKIANHNFTVIAIDAGYTNPYPTDFVVVAPGQTTDVLLRTDQPVGSYYIAASPYITSQNIPIDNTTTRGILEYEGSNTSSISMPTMPAYNDTPTANRFYTNMTGLSGGPHYLPVPTQIDHHLFVTAGMALLRCPTNMTCLAPNGTAYSASMNNESFVLPSGRRASMLEAFFRNISGVYTKDFPANPPLVFDYTNSSNSFNYSLVFAPKSTKVYRLEFNSTVEVIWQNTALVGIENHPIHIHGMNFYVLAQGFGNYDDTQDRPKFNLVNPQMRNTIAVPTGGWAVIRFQAKNPGVWLVHCHVDAHLSIGFAMAFEIENGNTPLSTLPPPPLDLPVC